MRKQVQYTGIKGMNQDLNISKYSPEFTFKNYNIRINSRNESTLLTMTNSMGNTKVIPVDSNTQQGMEIVGYTIGYTIVEDYLVLFTTTRETTTPLTGTQVGSVGIDRIYRFQYFNNKLQGKLIFSGDLNFAADALIESIGVFETKEVVKVYWVDKNNQPRFINIVSDKPYNNNTFNFCPDLQLKEDYTILNHKTGGSFHSGVIQYAFSYWNLNGVETNIFLSTDVIPIGFEDRGGSPEDICTRSFAVTISNLDKNFDYLRMYSIHRTSYEGTPSVRVVKDVELSTLPVTFTQIIDDGIIGYEFPNESLPFIGGEELIIGTISTKENILFGGNITLKRPSLKDVNLQGTFTWETKSISIENSSGAATKRGLYLYEPYTLNANFILRHWKKGETYRIGLRAQYKTGIWSEVLYIEDSTPNIGYKTSIEDSSGNILNGLKVDYVIGKYEIDSTSAQTLQSLGFKKIQLVYVPLNAKDRSIVAQGVLTNTIAKVGNRMNNSPFAYPDYFTRPQAELNSASVKHVGGLSTLEWAHFKPLSYGRHSSSGTEYYTEIAARTILIADTFDANFHIGKILEQKGYTTSWDKLKDTWFIDRNLVNFWGPDVEFGNIRSNLGGVDSFKIRGIANVSGSYTNSKYFFEEKGDASSGWSTTNYNANTQFTYINPFVSINTGKDFKNVVMSLWDYPRLIFEKGFIPWNFTNGDKLNPIIANALEGFIEDNLSDTMNKKIISRLVYCGFNDMFLDNVTLPSYNITKPKYIDKDDVMNTFNSDNSSDGSGGNILYANKIEELNNLDIARGVVEVNYASNSHLLFNLKNSNFLPIWQGSYNSSSGVSSNISSPYYRKGNNTSFTNTALDSNYLLGKSSNFMKARPSQGGAGYPYLFIVDLVRNISSNVKYGGKSKESIESNVWIPAGKAKELLVNTTLEATYGDTYLQRYDVLKTGSNTSTLYSISEVLSVFLESYINLDGRYDTKRGGVVENYRIDNYTHLNPVYTQKDNLFPGTALDYTKLQSDKMPASIILSKVKLSSELIDRWTSLWLNNTYDVDGSLGKINKLIRHNDSIWGFQNKGIFNVLYNPRVQIPTSDGIPIEITQSLKMEGVKYISTSIGATNKWAIKGSNRSLYFMDSENKDIYAIGDGLSNITEELGFKSWAVNNIKSLSEYNLINNRDSFIFNTDSIEDDLYINNYINSLSLSERMSIFETFHSHEDIPWMFSFKNKFYSIRTGNSKSSIWENNSNYNNTFYGEKRPSSVEFYINPEPHLDKVFDNFEYRADILDIHNNYLAGKTFKEVIVRNEYQYGSANLNVPMSFFKNKKFRTWSFPFPRHKGTLNRIRNPWVKLKLVYDNQGNHRLYFHDLIITYNI